MPADNKTKAGQNILLDALLDYILPIFNKKSTNDNKKSDKRESKLEELVKKDKLGLKPAELTLLEDFVNSLLATNKEIKQTKFKEGAFGEKSIFGFEELKNKENKNEEDEIRYSIAFERKKGHKENSGYSVEIRYEESEIQHKLNVKITFEDYTSNKNPVITKDKLNDSKKGYSIELTREKQDKTKDNYSVKLVYESSYEEERLSINYKSTLGAYLNKRNNALHDFSDRVPGKHVSTFSRNEMPGVLGFTYLGQDRMALRDDLIGKTRKMVDIHESIHTPDEYETRILTDWIMQKSRVRYIK